MNTIAKTFSEILKFNPWHDRIGRFTSGSGSGATFSANPNTKTGAAAIKRAQENNPLIGQVYGTVKTPGQIKAKQMARSSKAAAEYVMSKYGIQDKRQLKSYQIFIKRLMKKIYYDMTQTTTGYTSREKRLMRLINFLEKLSKVLKLKHQIRIMTNLDHLFEVRRLKSPILTRPI